MPEEAASAPVGREAELARLVRFTDELSAGSAAAALIRGEAGIGKTVLWRAAIAAARSADVRVLATRCVASEMPIAVCALADLVEGSVEEVADALPAPQREALSAAIGLEASAAPPPDRVTLPRAVSTTLRLLAEDGPVLVAVDDAQWLDPASRRLLAFALRRLGDRPVGAVVTIRGEGREPDPLSLADCYEGSRLIELTLGPLSAGAIGKLLRSALDVHLPRPALNRVHEASGGNPMYALELARGVGRELDVGSLARLPLPASLQELVRERLERLPPELGPLLELVAVLDRPTPPLIRDAIGEVADADALLDAAVGDELLVSDRGVVRFSHPLLAAAVYGRMPPGRRRALHRRLAETLVDVEERARHLALATEDPDPGVAAELDAATREAIARGALDAAAMLAREARRLTPAADGAARAERAIAEAEYLIESGDVSRARARVDELLGGEVGGPARARALQLHYLLSPPPTIAEGKKALEQAVELAAPDPHLRVRLLAWLAHAQGWAGDYVTAERRAREAVELAASLDDPPLSAFVAVVLADIARVRGSPRPEAFERLLGAAPAGGLAGEPPPAVILGRERCEAGDLATARALLEPEVASCEARGEEFDRANVLFDLVDVEFRAGSWALASRHLDEVLVAQADGENFFGVAAATSFQALLAAHRGEVDEARGLARAEIERGHEWGWEELVVRNHWILGFIELSLGEPRRAWAELEGLPERRERIGIREPGYCPLAPDAIEAVAALGRLADAERLLDDLTAVAEELEHRWARPAALRCRALIELGGGDAEEALVLADRAVAGFEESGHRFDRGRALLVSGDALRRLGRRRDAAARLEAAREAFERLGARLWLERAERELRRAAPRPRRDDGLTAAESRVAALVIGGRTNREVAAELFTTVSTVEAHLTRVYRKLDVRSRTELARLAADGDLELDPGLDG